MGWKAKRPRRAGVCGWVPWSRGSWGGEGKYLETEKKCLLAVIPGFGL